MTKIIGHRGVMGLALQNTLSAIRNALKLDLYAIEIDVRMTKDGYMVLLHDKTTRKVSKTKTNIREVSYAELNNVVLHNGEHIPTLEEVFQLVGNQVPLMIDLKDSGLAGPLLQLLDRYPEVQVFFSGRQYEDLKKLHTARPDIPFLLQHHYDPIDIIHNAHHMEAHGICINMWLMNPWTYRLAKERNLEVMVYSVNHRWLLRFFQKFYPEAIIITNHPVRLLGKRRSGKHVSSKQQ